MDIAEQSGIQESDVIGISRSGRVRKKSSKLMDFQSPEETTKKHYKILHKIKSEPELDIDEHFMMEQRGINEFSDLKTSEDDEEEGTFASFGDGEDDDDESEDFEPIERASLIQPLQTSNMLARQSIYMTEKSNKKRMTMKDGRVIMQKAQRKDKGKSRFTAFFMWAKSVRQEMMNTHPELDFSAVSKKLGELWGNVPSAEKYNWKRRAKRLSAKMMSSRAKIGNQTIQMQTKQENRFINKGYGKVGRPPKIPRDPVHQTMGESIPKSYQRTKAKEKYSSAEKIKTEKASSSSPNYKITGKCHTDIAAFLKLLGDNLTIIGERLKEHEGQITVSGSLSVLLDSMLCSISPLMCLTTFLPGLGEKLGPEKQQFLEILDNIAYVMPGL